MHIFINEWIMNECVCMNVCIVHDEWMNACMCIFMNVSILHNECMNESMCECMNVCIAQTMHIFINEQMNGVVHMYAFYKAMYVQINV